MNKKLLDLLSVVIFLNAICACVNTQEDLSNEEKITGSRESFDSTRLRRKDEIIEQHQKYTQHLESVNILSQEKNQEIKNFGSVGSDQEEKDFNFHKGMELNEKLSDGKFDNKLRSGIKIRKKRTFKKGCHSCGGGGGGRIGLYIPLPFIAISKPYQPRGTCDYCNSQPSPQPQYQPCTTCYQPPPQKSVCDTCYRPQLASPPCQTCNQHQPYVQPRPPPPPPQPQQPHCNECNQGGWGGDGGGWSYSESHSSASSFSGSRG